MKIVRPGYDLNPPRPSFFRRNSSVILALLVLAAILHNIFGSHGYVEMRRMQRQVESLRQEIDQAKRENESLAQHANELKTDPAAIERIAREDMGLAREGERIFKLSPDKQGGKAPQSPPSRE